MYLSRLTLNPRTRRVQRELANPYELHRTLLRAFPEQLPASERVLFRVDVDERTGVPTVLLQSHTAPDWAWLGEPGAAHYLLQAPESKPFTLTFAPELQLSFRLRANPTIKHSAPGEKQGRRDPLYREEEQRAWLERKGAQGGFRIVQLHIAGEGNTYGRQPLPKAEISEGEADTAQPKFRKLTLHAVRFEGVLQVTDPDALWRTVQSGLGSGKSFGFGLLSLALA